MMLFSLMAAGAAPACAFLMPFQTTYTHTGRNIMLPSSPLSSFDRNHNDIFLEGPRPTEIESAENNQLFDELLKVKERRDALMATEMFQTADGIIIEAIVQTMEKLPIKKAQNLFKQGEAGDGSIYIVASGTFECVDESTGEVKKECRNSDIFGEISPKFGTKRALTVKASSDDAAVWKISYQGFTDSIKSKTDAFDSSLVSSIQENPEYVEYFAMKERSDVFQKIPFFKAMQTRDFDEVVKSASLRNLMEGEILFNEGDRGDTMYVVKEGSINVFSEKTKKVLKTCKKGGILGEFAIFFSTSNQRPASAQATEGSQLWEVHRDVLFEAVQESDLSTQALDVYREAYNDKQFSVVEFMDYLTVKARPKSKPVSLHSTFSIVSTGFALAVEAMQFSPGVGSNGYFQIFDIYQNLDSSSVMQIQIAAWLMAASGVLGIFRLPANSPNNRRLLFEFWMWTNISNAATISSNLFGYPTLGWYNGLEFPGNILILATTIMTYISGLSLVDDAIAGSNRGREANPLATNRAQAFAISLVALILLFITQTSVIMSILSDAGVATFSFGRSLEEGSELSTILQMLGVFFWPAILQSSFGALLATLQFKKKIDPKAGAAVGIAVLSILNYDGIYTLFNHPAEMPNLFEMYYSACPPYFFAYWGTVVATIVQAFGNRQKVADETCNSKSIDEARLATRQHETAPLLLRETV